MSSRRTLILIGAIVIGGLAAFLTLNYVRGVENDNAERNQLVEVLVATGPMSAGSSADEAVGAKMISTAKRRRADLPTNVVSRSAEISGQVSAVDLGGGEIITTTMFVSPDARTGSNASMLDKGNVAVTISTDDTSGVASLIQVGDSINILAKTTPVNEEEAKGLAPGGGWVLPSAYVTVFQDVKVVAVGQNIDAPKPAAPVEEGAEAPAATAPAASGLLTVQLPPDQAVLLTGLRDLGLSVTLNRPDYEPVPLPFRGTVPTFSGELGISPYPEQAAGAKGK
ncbi:MAG: Flp pilus assembly protein CpaB [Microthrixaceae bacterium]